MIQITEGLLADIRRFLPRRRRLIWPSLDDQPGLWLPPEQQQLTTTTFTPTKTAQTDLQAWANFTQGTWTEGTSLDVSGMFAVAIQISVGRKDGTAFTAGAPNIHIQGSVASSGNDRWKDLQVFQPPVGASIGATTANGAIAAAAATFVVTSATNIAANDYLFLGHTTTVGNYELIRVLSMSGTTVTPVHAVVNAHDTGCEITSQATEVLATIGLQGISRLRAVIDTIGSGRDIRARVECTGFVNVTGV